ncbi:MAG: FlaG/FlaF family flagellin (archaellin) [Halobacteriales archaeon]|jgi:FlaG/FlaF family flagellin (archaellin)
MRVRNPATDDAAVSSVIAVVLMVALTIVLAASVGVFVLGIGQEATNQADTPKVKYATEYVNESGSDATLSITVKGGDTVKAANLEVIIDGTTAWKGGAAQSNFTSTSNWSSEVKSGDTLTLDANHEDLQDGDRLMIVWRKGDASTILLDRTI